MCPGQNFLTQVGSGQIFIARIGSVIFGLGLALENFPLKSQIFNFLPFGSKKSHRVAFKSTQASLLFTAGQKYARVGVHFYCE